MQFFEMFTFNYIFSVIQFKPVFINAIVWLNFVTCYFILTTEEMLLVRSSAFQTYWYFSGFPRKLTGPFSTLCGVVHTMLTLLVLLKRLLSNSVTPTVFKQAVLACSKIHESRSIFITQIVTGI